LYLPLNGASGAFGKKKRCCISVILSLSIVVVEYKRFLLTDLDLQPATHTDHYIKRCQIQKAMHQLLLSLETKPDMAIKKLRPQRYQDGRWLGRMSTI
jgi:hypothetical protein